MVFIYGRSNRDLGRNSGGSFSAGSSSLETDDVGDLLFSLSLYEKWIAWGKSQCLWMVEMGVKTGLMCKIKTEAMKEVVRKEQRKRYYPSSSSALFS